MTWGKILTWVIITVAGIGLSINKISHWTHNVSSYVLVALTFTAGYRLYKEIKAHPN